VPFPATQINAVVLLRQIGIQHLSCARRVILCPFLVRDLHVCTVELPVFLITLLLRNVALLLGQLGTPRGFSLTEA
jgi:hypothetical protein